MVSLVAVVAWDLHFIIVIPAFLVFGTLDGLYLTSAMIKVPDGAWFTLCLAVILSSVFVLWRYGKENQWRVEASDRISPRHLLTMDSTMEGSEVWTGMRMRPSNAPVTKLRGVGIFFDKTGSPSGTPSVFIHFLHKFQAAPSVIVFFHVRPLSIPTLPEDERFSVSRCSSGLGSSSSGTFPNIFRVTIRHGYADRVFTNDLSLFIYENLRDFIIREGTTLSPAIRRAPEEKSSDSDEQEEQGTQKRLQQETVRHNLETLQVAYEEQVVNIVGKEQMRIDEVRKCSGWPRKIFLAAFLWLRSNTGNKVANMNLDIEKLVEVGFVKTI